MEDRPAAMWTEGGTLAARECVPRRAGRCATFESGKKNPARPPAGCPNPAGKDVLRRIVDNLGPERGGMDGTLVLFAVRCSYKHKRSSSPYVPMSNQNPMIERCSYCLFGVEYFFSF